ncbi:restriction endonuclease subunit S [uncultured Actinomyces sp.]|uniref:restriction endonuclease subunit S n=1 Tax=uncultured Actinomyces sp. TaxID=249061 RepID=UPI0028D90610|nr:restriction endonuclease subunit S [uncultured Actinomyces sp.]
MIADRLRAAILQAAISGKLTDQRPEDGTAKDLLEHIAAERAALVKKKKIKKQKLLPRVNVDDQAFVLPASWSWISFGETISLLSGRDLTPEQYSDRPDGIPYITGASNFSNGSIIVNRWTAQPLTVAHQGDLLITCKGTIGDLAVLEEAEAHIARQIMAITCLQVRRGYIAAFLEYSVAALKAQAKSMIPGISRDMLLTTPLPLPPLAEQERIVAKLEELLPLTDQLAELEREREYLDREFAKAIERAILQAAISGKLTKQHPEDGTAKELLETIKTERQQLEKEGKIKKQKPLPPVDKTDEPFDLPDSWVWSRLGRVFNMQAGKNVAVGNISEVGEYPCYGGNGIRGYVADYNRDGTYPIIGRQGALCGNINVASGRFFATEHAVVVETFGHTSPAWAALALEQLNLNQYATATAQPGLSVEKLKVVPVPVPPVDEQERIAAKLDRALPLARGLGELVS